MLVLLNSAVSINKAVRFIISFKNITNVVFCRQQSKTTPRSPRTVPNVPARNPRINLRRLQRVANRQPRQTPPGQQTVSYTPKTPNAHSPPSSSYSDPIFRRSTADLSGSEASNHSPPSSAESDPENANSGLPKVADSSIDKVLGHPVSRPGATMKLPPLPPSPPLKIDRGKSNSSRWVKEFQKLYY